MINRPKINNNDIKVLGRVVTIASDNKLAPAEQIFDELFQYSALPRYSGDNIDMTAKGLDQYTINRLFGRKFRTLDLAGIFPDAEGWLNNVKIKALTVADGLTVTGGATVDNLNVTNTLIVDGTDVKERLDWLYNVITGADKDNAIWEAIIGLQGDLAELREDFEECCNEVKEALNNLPQGGGITITCVPDPIEMTVGDPDQILTITSNPNLAGNPTVTSNNTNVATIVNGGSTSNNPKVHAVAPGNTTITITWQGQEKTVNVTINEPEEVHVYDLTISKEDDVMTAGGDPITVIATPTDNGTPMVGETISWASSTASVASVADGVITPLTQGTTTITAMWTDPKGTVHRATCDITVNTNTPVEPNILYTVTYMDDGSLITTEEYEAGETIRPLHDYDPLTREGYTLSWDGMPANMIMPAENITVTAIWTEIEEPVVETHTFVISPASKTMTVGDNFTFVAKLDGTITNDVTWDYVDDASSYVTFTGDNGAIHADTVGTAVITVHYTGSDQVDLNATATITISAELQTIEWGFLDKELTIRVGESTLATIVKGGNNDITGAAFQRVTQPNVTSYPIQLGIGVGEQPDGTSLQTYITGVNVGDAQVKAWPYTPQELPNIYDILTVHVIEPDSTTFITIDGPDTIPVGSSAVVYTSDVTLGSDNYLNTTSNVPNSADWTIADSSIIKVNDDYKLSTDPIDSVQGQNQIYIDALTEGTTTITARSTQYPGIVCTKTVTVSAAEEPVELTYTITFKDCHPDHNFTIGDDSFDQYAVTLGTQTYHAGDTINEMGLVEARTAVNTNATWSRDNYNLRGWNNIPYGSVMPDHNIIVYAIWEEIENPPEQNYDLIIKPDFSTTGLNQEGKWYDNNGVNTLDNGGTALLTLWARSKTDPSDEYTISGTWSATGNNADMVSVHGQGTFCTVATNGIGSTETKTVTIQATHVDFTNPATVTITLSPIEEYTLSAFPTTLNLTVGGDPGTVEFTVSPQASVSNTGRILYSPSLTYYSHGTDNPTNPGVSINPASLADSPNGRDITFYAIIASTAEVLADTGHAWDELTVEDWNNTTLPKCSTTIKVVTNAEPTPNEHRAIFFDPGLIETGESDEYSSASHPIMSNYANAFELGRTTFYAGSRQLDLEYITEEQAKQAAAALGHSRVGYHLPQGAGWDVGLYDTMPDSNIYIKARWVANDRDIVYMDGNTELDRQSSYTGATITPITSPTKTGFTFGGWDGMPQDGKVPGTDTANDPLILHATWNGAAAFTVDPSELSMIAGEHTHQMTAKLDGVAISENVTWSSSDSTVVSIDASGLATAEAEGTATITATTTDERAANKTATCSVTVTVRNPRLRHSGGQQSNIGLCVGESADFREEVLDGPEGCRLVWESDDNSICEISVKEHYLDRDASETITIKAIGEGVATITAALVDSEGNAIMAKNSNDQSYPVYSDVINVTVSPDPTITIEWQTDEHANLSNTSSLNGVAEFEPITLDGNGDAEYHNWTADLNVDTGYKVKNVTVETFHGVSLINGTPDYRTYYGGKEITNNSITLDATDLAHSDRSTIKITVTTEEE